MQRSGQGQGVAFSQVRPESTSEDDLESLPSSPKDRRRSRRSAVQWERLSTGAEFGRESLEPLDGPADVVAALAEAVKGCADEAARGILAEHPEAARRWRQCATLLHSAAAEGSEPMLELLLTAGAPLGSLDEDGQTALHVACANEHVGAASVLSARAPCWELLVEDKYGMTPLHLASESGDELLVACLLERLKNLGASGDVDDALRRLRRGTVEFLAERHGHLGVLGLLHEAGGPVGCVPAAE